MQLTKGKYFFIVDSDDWLVPNVVELINDWCNDIEQDSNFEKFAGVSGLREYPNEQINGGNGNGKLVIDATNLERRKFNLGGDKGEVDLTDVHEIYIFDLVFYKNIIQE